MPVNEQSMLIIGGDSQIGRALFAKLEKNTRVVATTRKPRPGSNQLFLDLARPEMLAVEPTFRYDAVIICAGLTSIAQCEDAPDASWKVNVQGILGVIERLKHATDRFVFLSSDQVYDGDKSLPCPSAEVCPRSQYGRQKVAVEEVVKNHSESSAIIRLTKVIHDSNPFFSSLSQAIREQSRSSVFTNYFFSPLSLDFAVASIERVLEERISGVVHLSGDSDISYSDAADYLLSRLGGSPSLLNRISCSSDRLPAGHKRYVSLGGSLYPGTSSDVGLKTLDCFL